MSVEATGWLASLLTMVAAAMTAANLGPRLTGWGFVVFTFGSLTWIAVATMNSENSQLLTHIFLTLVNIFGVWRWLGREAKYAKGGSDAARRSKASDVPTLFSSVGLAGSKVTGSDGESLGTVVDAMLQCDRAQIAYVVIGDGALGGTRESLRAVVPERLEFKRDGVAARFGRDEFLALPPLQDNAWPASTRVAEVG